jgi:hypothetical protein
MAYTMQNVVDKGRIPLNDSAKTRYSDTDLLGYANDAILRVRDRRPDLFIGRWLTLPGGLALGDAFPIRDEFFPPVVDYVTSRAEVRDDEFSDNNRVVMLMSMFDKAVG